MLFTITSEVLIYDDKEDKYYVKQVEAIDYYHSKIYFPSIFKKYIVSATLTFIRISLMA